MLTIGQLASYAGTTTRAVRHYHAKGLLAEPDRDASGYRRYDAAAVVDLIRIRTLAEAGVPLARVHDLLDADLDDFADAIAAIDERLSQRIDDLQEHRSRIAQLDVGDRLALPDEAVAYLDQLRALDMPDRVVEMERDAWIIVAAQIPDQMPALMALKQAQLDDPLVRALYDDILRLADRHIDDPELIAFADRLAAMFDDALIAKPDPVEPTLAPELAAVLDQVFVDAVPAARALLALLEARGWTGWTQLERAQPTEESDRR